MTPEEKINKWNLRTFESLWAIQVNLPAADINELGLAQFLEEYKVSAISYPVLAGCYFLMAMIMARVAPNPKVRRLTAVGGWSYPRRLRFSFRPGGCLLRWLFSHLLITSGHEKKACLSEVGAPPGNWPAYRREFGQKRAC